MAYKRELSSRFFWRTHTGAELDYVEEKDGGMHGYEFKFGFVYGSLPKAWVETYPGATAKVINLENYLSFLTDFRDDGLD
jgi:hypothetical protein